MYYNMHAVVYKTNTQNSCLKIQSVHGEHWEEKITFIRTLGYV